MTERRWHVRGQAVLVQGPPPDTWAAKRLRYRIDRAVMHRHREGQVRLGGQVWNWQVVE